MRNMYFARTGLGIVFAAALMFLPQVGASAATVTLTDAQIIHRPGFTTDTVRVECDVFFDAGEAFAMARTTWNEPPPGEGQTATVNFSYPNCDGSIHYQFDISIWAHSGLVNGGRFRSVFYTIKSGMLTKSFSTNYIDATHP